MVSAQIFSAHSTAAAAHRFVLQPAPFASSPLRCQIWESQRIVRTPKPQEIIVSLLWPFRRSIAAVFFYERNVRRRYLFSLVPLCWGINLLERRPALYWHSGAPITSPPRTFDQSLSASALSSVASLDPPMSHLDKALRSIARLQVRLIAHEFHQPTGDLRLPTVHVLPHLSLLPGSTRPADHLAGRAPSSR